MAASTPLDLAERIALIAAGLGTRGEAGSPLSAAPIALKLYAESRQDDNDIVEVIDLIAEAEARRR